MWDTLYSYEIRFCTQYIFICTDLILCTHIYIRSTIICSWTHDHELTYNNSLAISLINYQPHLLSPHLLSPHLLSPHLLSPHLLSPHLLSIHLLSASIAIRSICYQASLAFKTFALQSAINADLLSKTSYRGVQEHLCRGGTFVLPPGNIVPPWKTPF